MKTVQPLQNNNINNFLCSRIKETKAEKHLQCTDIYTIDSIALIKIYKMK